MARLNEATAPPESIDALKRRFVRQNREIARINSIQSLRIRSLESEVSHLLSENVSLREQVISLGQEIERLDEAKAFQDGVYDAKAKIDAKLIELSSLVTDLGSLPHKFDKPSHAKAKSSILRDPGQPISDLKRRSQNSEFPVGADDGRLPVILEDKFYPRRTLESEDVQNLINNEPKIQVSSEPNDASINQLDAKSNIPDPRCPEDLDGTEEVNPDADDSSALPPTLEMRRKKRFGSAAAGESSARTGPLITNSDTEHTMKSGFKRKFDPEEDDKYGATSMVTDDGFEFSRSAQGQHESSEGAVSEDADRSPIKGQVDSKQGSRNCGPSKRKVLGPKSTNTSVVPPNRVARRPRDDKARQMSDREDEVYKSQPDEPKKQAMRKHNNLNANTGAHQPKRHVQAANDLEQPIRQDTQETAKPILSSSESPPPRSENNVLGAPSRTTRRQKAIVSYAEPNLRAKMRRPTTELADAVAGDRARRSSSSQPVSGESADHSEMGTTKSSRGSDPGTFPGEFLLNSFGDTVSQRKRRTLPANKDDSLDNRALGNESVGNKLMQSKKVRRKTSTTNKGTWCVHTDGAGSNTEPHDARTKDSNIHATAITSASEFGQLEASGHVLGEDSSHDELGTSQLDNEQAPYLAADTRQTDRGQRVAARRRSMML